MQSPEFPGPPGASVRMDQDWQEDIDKFDPDSELAQLDCLREEEDEEERELNDLNRLIVEVKNQSAMEETAREVHEEGLAPQSFERPLVVDDFIRNFFSRHGLKRSLDAFQAEWYQLKMQQRLSQAATTDIVPDIYIKNQTLVEENEMLKVQLDKARQVAEGARSYWSKFKKERDFHRMHHKRVNQEKQKLLTDLKRLRSHYEHYEPTLTELKHKYEVAMKEKFLLSLERDRLITRIEQMQRSIDQLEGKKRKDSIPQSVPLNKSSGKNQDTPWPPEERTNPFLTSKGSDSEPPNKSMRVQRTFKAHEGPISRLALHPKLPIVGSAGDDHTWKLWSLPEGQLVMSGEGHKDWVGDLAFHPQGKFVVTGSGDTTVKLWDVMKERCSHTFTEHTQAVWSTSFHDLGDFFASGSMDQSARIFDLHTLRCRQSLRGHVDSVNHVCFQPFSTNLATVSGDKTLSLWDMRSGLCVQTFYGHRNSINHVAFEPAGAILASSDADGIVKLWDCRLVAEVLQVDSGQYPAHAASFDRSATLLSIASGDGTIKMFDIQKKAFVVALESHEDSVQDVAFDPLNNEFLMSAGADGTLRLWQ